MTSRYVGMSVHNDDVYVYIYVEKEERERDDKKKNQLRDWDFV